MFKPPPPYIQRPFMTSAIEIAILAKRRDSFGSLPMIEKYAPTINLYCMIRNTEIVLHSTKYDLRKISFNPTSTTFTVWAKGRCVANPKEICHQFYY